VPIVGQTTLGSGQTKALLKKAEYWERSIPTTSATAAIVSSGALPPRTGRNSWDRLRKAGVEMGDTLLWWIALGYDGPRLMADA